MTKFFSFIQIHRLAVSNMAYEVSAGRKTIEDQATLDMLMMHSGAAATTSYQCKINDGTYGNGIKGKELFCKKVRKCLLDNPEFVEELILGAEANEEGKEE